MDFDYSTLLQTIIMQTGTLYRIFNVNSGESYIGKTYRDLYTRLEEHINGINKYPHRALYKALKEAGIDNFSLEILGTFEQGLLELKEREAIIFFNSFEKGYNSTLGGEGSYLISKEVFDQVESLYVISKYSMLKISNKLSLDYGTVRDILRQRNITIKSCAKKTKETLSPRIRIVGVNIEFDTVSSCVEFLKDADIVSNETANKSIAWSIHRVAKKERNSYMGLTFEYY